MKVRHILLLTDLSKEALRPCESIAQFAREVGARITLLHVVQNLRVVAHGAPLAPPMSMPGLPELEKQAERELTEQRTNLPSDLEVKTDVIAEEHIPKAVVHYAEENDVDLIALSTHGRTGLRHLALGSVAEAILRHSTVPVLSFPRPK